MSTATINMTKGRANDSNMRVLYRTFSTACRKGVLGLRDDAAVAGRMTGQSVIMVKQVPTISGTFFYPYAGLTAGCCSAWLSLTDPDAHRDR
jgi:hypothetical protein